MSCKYPNTLSPPLPLPKLPSLSVCVYLCLVSVCVCHLCLSVCWFVEFFSSLLLSSLSLHIAGGVHADHFCLYCEDTKDDRIFFFEMRQTTSGENIFSVAESCGVFPDDLWSVNAAGHPESGRPPVAATGLKVSSLPLWYMKENLKS